MPCKEAWFTREMKYEIIKTLYHECSLSAALRIGGLEGERVAFTFKYTYWEHTNRRLKLWHPH